MIKAIETVYNGYRFRSRLEARWAVFFDKLGLKYQYELEGFDLTNSIFPSAGYYLPDFYLPSLNLWVEIKNGEKLADSEIMKIVAFGVELEKLFIITKGLPDNGFSLFNPWLRWEEYKKSANCIWGTGRKCEDEIWILEKNDDFSFCLNPIPNDDDNYPLSGNFSIKLSTAYDAARQARF